MTDPQDVSTHHHALLVGGQNITYFLDGAEVDAARVYITFPTSPDDPHA